MRLTDNQALVYRTILFEEIESGATDDEAAREAYRFMLEDALPDWRQFWHDWNAPPGPLEQMMNMVTTLMVIETLTRNPSIIQKMTEPVANALRMLTGGEADS